MASYEEDKAGFAGIEYASNRYARAVAKEVGQDAQRLCPVDTGKLQASIETEVADKTVYVWVGGPGIEYWIFQEFGTSRHPAQPFMRPSLQRRRNVQYMIDDPTL